MTKMSLLIWHNFVKVEIIEQNFVMQHMYKPVIGMRNFILKFLVVMEILSENLGGVNVLTRTVYLACFVTSSRHRCQLPAWELHVDSTASSLVSGVTT